MYSLCLLALVLSSVFAAPQPQSNPTSLPLLRRSRPPRSSEEWAAAAAALRAKYNVPPRSSEHEKRGSVSSVPLTNLHLDSSYSAPMTVGTPPLTYNVVLDTGSSDAWLTGTSCDGCNGGPQFQPSSSFQSSGNPVQIKYGSGTVTGTVGTDIVSVGGFTVQDQTMAVVNSISSQLLVGNVSGLLGLGFASIANTRGVPFWERLVQQGAWAQPLMSFFITRFLDDPSAGNAEPGGVFTMGGTNTSFYTGDVDFVTVPTGLTGGFWMIPIAAVNAKGAPVTLSRSNALAAIDTGTTLIGAPGEDLAAIFANIPGSQRGTGNWDGFYLYPCSTKVNLQLNFGSQTWSVSDDDFNLARVQGNLCAGAVFELTSSGSSINPLDNSPQWVVGDTFLKNVYSVFRYAPVSVGFATLVETGNGSGHPATGSALSSWIGMDTSMRWTMGLTAFGAVILSRMLWS